MLFVDAHVHIYDCFDLAAMFDAAFFNFRQQAIRLGSNYNFQGALLLTERDGENWFEKLVYQAPPESERELALGDWQVLQTEEESSLLLVKPGGEKLVLIAGRQLVSSEGLEVLALITTDTFREKEPAARLITEITNGDAIPVIPWAFGKWFGARGKVLTEMLHDKEKMDFYLGDNGGRPSFFPYPTLLQSAVQKGQKILSGSDPLPLPGDELRVGSFGFYAETLLEDTKPAAQLRLIIRDQDVLLNSFGAPMNVFRFVRNQIALRGL